MYDKNQNEEAYEQEMNNDDENQLNNTYGKGQNALHVASKRGHKEIVELLIQKGIDIQKKDGYVTIVKEERHFFK